MHGLEMSCQIAGTDKALITQRKVADVVPLVQVNTLDVLLQMFFPRKLAVTTKVRTVEGLVFHMDCLNMSLQLLPLREGTFTVRTRKLFEAQVHTLHMPGQV